MEGYETLLDRAYSLLQTGAKSSERFVVPQAEIMYDGRNTVIRNLKEVSERLRREPKHILGYLARELGCPGVIDGPRGVLKSKVTTDNINARINDYTNKFVMCLECRRPDTHMDKVGRITMLICESCGAQRPVHLMHLNPT
jgi:translation initiation factor 2 subunit 2